MTKGKQGMSTYQKRQMKEAKDVLSRLDKSIKKAQKLASSK
jgi:hypothetical protein